VAILIVEEVPIVPVYFYDGFNYFNPRDLADNPFVPKVQVTDFKLRNRSVSFIGKNAELNKPVYLTDKIVLPYSENMISFEFASMDFASPEKKVGIREQAKFYRRKS